MGRPSKYAPEVKEWAIRMVREHRPEMSVRRGALDAVDDEDLQRPLFGFEFQPELVTQCSEEWWPIRVSGRDGFR
jgi:hypothetical protein